MRLPEAAVEEQLDAADPEPAGAGAAPDAARAPAPASEATGGWNSTRSRSASGGLEPLEGGQRGVALDVVDAGDAQPVGLGLRLAERGVEQRRAAARAGAAVISSTARSSSRPVGSPARVADDPAAERIGRVAA